MIIGQFHISRIPSFAAEANPVLVINPNAVLPLPVSLQRVKPVAGRNSQVVEPHCTMQQPKPSQGHPRNHRPTKRCSRWNNNSVFRSVSVWTAVRSSWLTWLTMDLIRSGDERYN